jgi:acetyl esterase/lipase
MKKLFFLFVAVLLCSNLSATDYHFQEGFASSTPSGWTRQCNSTSSLNHTGLAFSGAYAVKFDATGSGRYNKNLISPQVTGADTLSFYVSKNANATYMTLYVGKIVGSDTTILQSYDAYNFPNKSATPGFAQIVLPIRSESENMKIILYATVSTDPDKVNAGWFIVDDIELSRYSGASSDPSAAVDKITTDFGDGTWGTIATTAYPSGSYPTYSVNGFNLNKAYLYTGTVTCPSGETHTNRILLGKSSESAAVEFPALKTIGEVEIHAVTGTDAMSFRLEEWSGTQWQALGTFTTRKAPDSIYNIVVSRNYETKLRIANNTSSGLYIYKIATRTYQEMMDVTLRSTSPAEGEVVFSNLEKTASLTFNKNIEKASGIILLNGVSIPLSDCTVKDNVVSFPVSLAGTPSGNQDYTLSVPAGTFAEAGNSSNLSKSITVHFQTLKTVAYPSGYNAQIDVVYKNVGSTNCRMDIYYPTSPAKPVAVIINMHGGGWNHGYKEEQGGFSIYFDKGYAVANVEYRMTGEATAPAAVEDVRGAMHYLLNHAGELNIDPNKIVFQGGSAGGHLALTGGYLQNNRMYDNDCVQYPGNFKVMAVIDKYGPSDLKNFMFYSSLVSWLGPHASDNTFIRSISPVALVNASTPPTYIIHGDADPTVPYTQSVTLKDTLTAFGVKNRFTTVPGGLHGNFSDAYNDQMETEIIAFLSDVDNTTGTAVKNPGIDANANVYLSGGSIVIDSRESTLTEIYDPMGKRLAVTGAKSYASPHKGLYILKININGSETIRKIVVR